MAQPSTLFSPADDGEPQRGHSTGILPASHLRGMIQRGKIRSLREIEDAQIQRAVVGFLLVCPGDEARTELARLRKAAPDRVREAELLMGLSQGNR